MTDNEASTNGSSRPNTDQTIEHASTAQPNSAAATHDPKRRSAPTHHDLTGR